MKLIFRRLELTLFDSNFLGCGSNVSSVFVSDLRPKIDTGDHVAYLRRNARELISELLELVSLSEKERARKNSTFIESRSW